MAGSPCALTQGYTFSGCKTGIGGIKSVFLLEYGNLNQADPTKFAITAGVVTTLVQATGTQWRQYVLDKQMGMFTDNGTYSMENGTIAYNPVIDFTIKGLTTSVRNELINVSQNTLLMIVQGKNDMYWLFGLDSGMDMVSWSAESGTKIEDFMGQKLAFNGKSATPSYAVNATLIPALLLPGP